MIQDIVHVRHHGAKGDGSTDDTRALQSALNDAAGRTVQFESLTYRTTETLRIVGSGTTIEGAGALIDYYGGERALDFHVAAGKGYPSGVVIRALAIYVQRGEAAIGLTVRANHSTFEEVKVGLRRGTPNAVAFDLTGDENAGPVSNIFKNCAVQGQGPAADQTGIKMSAASPLHRNGCHNTWIGGRVGQCRLAFDLAGSGNGLFGPTVEGSGTAFSFGNAHGNFVFGPYLELVKSGYRYSAQASENGAVGAFVTGVQDLVSDHGVRNWFVTDVVPARLPMGLRFGKKSDILSALDHYEEGNWVPLVAGVDRPGRYTIDATAANYTRIGRQVTVTAHMRVTSHAVGSGSARFDGLPFPVEDGTTLAGSLLTSNIAWPHQVKSVSVRGTSEKSPRSFSLAGMRNTTIPYILLADDLVTGSELFVSISYLTQT